jgi:hypothetical protein
VNSDAANYVRGRQTRKAGRNRACSGVATRVKTVRLEPHESCEMELTREFPTTAATLRFDSRLIELISVRRPRQHVRLKTNARGWFAPDRATRLRLAECSGKQSIRAGIAVSASVGAAKLLLAARTESCGAWAGRRCQHIRLKTNARSWFTPERATRLRVAECPGKQSIRAGIAVSASVGAAKLLLAARTESCSDWAGRSSMTRELEPRSTFAVAYARPPDPRSKRRYRLNRLSLRGRETNCRSNRSRGPQLSPARQGDDVSDIDRGRRINDSAALWRIRFCRIVDGEGPVLRAPALRSLRAFESGGEKRGGL